MSLSLQPFHNVRAAPDSTPYNMHPTPPPWSDSNLCNTVYHLHWYVPHRLPAHRQDRVVSGRSLSHEGQMMNVAWLSVALSYRLMLQYSVHHVCMAVHAGRAPAMKLPCWWPSLAFLISSLPTWQQLWTSRQQP